MEKEWREGVRNVLRSVIAGSIAVSTVRKWIAEGGLEEGGGKAGGLKVEVGIGGERNGKGTAKWKGYHDWWVVPRVSK